jgi:hypothetical protein
MLVCPTPFHAKFTVIRVQIANLSCKLFPVDCHRPRRHPTNGPSF